MAVLLWMPLSQVGHAQVDPAIYAALEDSAKNTATFILYLGDQPDLSAAKQIADWNERGQFVFDTLTANATQAQTRLTNMATRQALPGHVTRFDPLWITNAIVVTGDRQALDQFAQAPEVSRILAVGKPDQPPAPDPEIPDRAPTAPEWGIDMIDAEQVWATYGITGAGITIGVVDTGVEWDHPALREQYRGWNGTNVDHNYNWFNPDPTAYAACPDPNVPCDWNQHGTNVTGIASGGEGENQVGVAPGARWIHALGCCPDNAALLSALQWMLAPTDLTGANPDPTLRPQVVNNSWGGHGGDLLFEDALNALRAAGIVPVVSAGNNGSECATLISPGDNPAAFAIGATSSADSIASFSSRGPNPFTGVGPEVTAPGVSIRSACLNDGYCSYSGTSQAAPHVAGTVALLLEAEPALIGQVDQIEEILRATAVQKTAVQMCGGDSAESIPNNVYGAGRIDALAAVEMVLDSGTIQGTVIGNGGRKLSGAQVLLSTDGYTLTQTTNAAGEYGFTVGEGTVTVAADAFGYQMLSPVVVDVAADTVETYDFEVSNLTQVTVSGIVTDSQTGQPISGATIMLDDSGLNTRTNSDGHFTLSCVPQGTYSLRAAAGGFADAVANIAVDGVAMQNMVLTPRADYKVRHSAETDGPTFEWIDATGGDAHQLGDDAFFEVDLPSSFTFYGVPFDSVFIGSNGFVSFGAGSRVAHGVVPFEATPNNAIYALATDLDPYNGAQGTIYTQALPDDRFVIQYDAVEHWPDGDAETFQIVLDSAENTITIQYLSVSNADNALIGVEDGQGEYGIVVDASPVAGIAYLFEPFSGWQAQPATIVPQLTFGSNALFLPSVMRSCIE